MLHVKCQASQLSDGYSNQEVSVIGSYDNQTWKPDRCCFYMAKVLWRDTLEYLLEMLLEMYPVLTDAIWYIFQLSLRHLAL